MGREVRKVPPHWEHPKRGSGRYHPLFDQSYEMRIEEWITERALWKRGEHPDQQAYPDEVKGKSYEAWNSDAPQSSDYIPYTEAEATWFQAYETVSEGTPISPPFATEAELVDWLVTNKDYWNQGPRTRANAEAFVKMGWAPSFIIGPHGFQQGIDAAGDLKPRAETEA